MKTIKFRAWDKKNKKMTFINDITFNVDDGSINQVSTGFMEHGENEDAPGDLEDIVLLQYTGLIDKNGKEVYEGDVIRQEYSVVLKGVFDPVSYGFVDQETKDGVHIGEVVIIASAGACMKNPKHYILDSDEWGVSNQYKNVAGYRCEVIGNKFEDPELLEQPNAN